MKQLERQEQVMLVRWIKLQYPGLLFAASMNGGSRHPIEAKNLKATGMLVGIPDLQIIKANRGFHGCFIEMKSPKGRVTSAQRWCLEALRDNGYYAEVAYGFDEGKKIVDWYLSGAT